MNARLGLPTGLAAMGVTEDDVRRVIIKAPWPTTATRPTRENNTLKRYVFSV
jgi:hypothetical protein